MGHVSLNWIFGSFNRRRRDHIFNNFKADLDELAKHQYLSPEEKQSLEGFNNKAVQLLDKQTQQVQLLFDRKVINLMQQIDLQVTVNSFYDGQGKAERIKNFPFPRHYGSFSFVFVCIFIFLLPFGIVGEFAKLG